MGKKKPIKLLEKTDEFNAVLCKLGTSWEIEDSDYKSLEVLFCHLYGHKKLSDINEVRLHVLSKKCNNDERINPNKSIDFSSFPPCSSTLMEHIKRVNYQVMIWKCAEQQFIEMEDPTEHGWTKVDESFLEPTWTKEDILPEEL